MSYELATELEPAARQPIAAAPPPQTQSSIDHPHRSAWIVDPLFDLIFVAGGLPLVLIGANVLTIGWRLPDPVGVTGKPGLLLGLVLVGQHLFADSHNVATHLRIWGSPVDRERFSFYRTWLVALFAPLFFAGLSSPDITGIYVYLFLMGVFWHYAAQSYGIALIYCYKRDYPLKLHEKRLMKLCMTSLAAFVILRMLSNPGFSPRDWYGVPIPFWGPFPAVYYNLAGGIFSLSAVAFSAVILTKILRERKLFPLPSLLVLLSVIALGLSESATNAMLWFYIPPFFHGTQYLAIYLTYALKERGETGPISFRRLFFSPVAKRLFLTTVIIGAMLYVVVPHLFEQFGYSYALVAGLVLAIVNFHHFLTDAAIWRLRDKRCRDLLLA